MDSCVRGWGRSKSCTETFLLVPTRGCLTVFPTALSPTSPPQNRQENGDQQSTWERALRTCADFIKKFPYCWHSNNCSWYVSREQKPVPRASQGTGSNASSRNSSRVSLGSRASPFFTILICSRSRRIVTIMQIHIRPLAVASKTF